MMLSLCVVLFLGLLGALLWVAYHKEILRFYPAVKTATSVGFLAVAAAAFIAGGAQNAVFFWGLLPCLVLCLVGDLMLGLATVHGKFFSKFFLSGVASFLVAHIGFCVLFTLVRPGGYVFSPLEYILPVCLVGTAALLMRSQKFRMKRMKKPVLLYSFFVGLMCAKGVHLAMLMQWSVQGVLIAAGSILFLLSDCVILFLYFYYKPRGFFRALNLSTYYIGVLLLALSV